MIVIDGVEIERTEEMVQRHFVSIAKRRLLKEFQRGQELANWLIYYEDANAEEQAHILFKSLQSYLVAAYREDCPGQDPSDKELLSWIDDNAILSEHLGSTEWTVWIDMSVMMDLHLEHKKNRRIIPPA